MENKALWLKGPGEDPFVDAAPCPEPGENELLVETKAVAVQPGEWKLQAGIIPIPLSYPTVIGLSSSGIVVKVGPGVARFQPGDRVASNSAGVLFNDHRFGAYQKYSLVPQQLTSKIGNTPFEDAAAISTAYGPISALFIHLGLERNFQNPRNTVQRVLVWGVSSSFGALSAQIANLAGYIVVGVANGRHAELASSIGVTSFLDRTSPSVVEQAVSLGPFQAVLAAADSAEDQMKIGRVLSAQGGGSFLSTMGVRPGVELPEGVTGSFHQFLDDYLNPDHHEFTEWAWWTFLESVFAHGSLKSVPLEIKGGLSAVAEAWDLLRHNAVSGKRLIILPHLD